MLELGLAQLFRSVSSASRLRSQDISASGGLCEKLPANSNTVKPWKKLPSKRIAWMRSVSFNG